MVLDRTPFYAESGGQVGDRGELSRTGACLTLFAVHDTQKIQPDVFGHHGEVKTGELRVGDTVMRAVDADARARSAWNHSATHLMHAALRKVLGGHVQQKGSLVDPERTRFDFSHPQADDATIEIRTVEALVNRAIRANYPVEARLMKYDEAIRSGAMALFGEKYGDEVRVLSMGDFSTELCGGTHVARTGDIGFFKIVSESGVAAGIRRVEAVTGEGALAYTHEIETRLNDAARVAESVADADIAAKIQQMQDNVEGAGKGAGATQGQAGVESGRRSAVAGGRSQRPRRSDPRARGDHRRRGRQSAARDARSAEGQLQVGGHRAGLDRRRQGDSDRGCDLGPDRENQGRRSREPCRDPGRRQRRRTARYGAGGWNGCRQRFPPRSRACAGWVEQRL